MNRSKVELMIKFVSSRTGTITLKIDKQNIKEAT